MVEEGLALSHGEVRDADLVKVTREPSLEEVRAQDWDMWGRVWWTQKGMETSVWEASREERNRFVWRGGRARPWRAPWLMVNDFGFYS